MMRAVVAKPRPKSRWWSPHLKGHLLQFGPRPFPDYEGSHGLRLLGIALVSEGLIGPRLGLVRWLGVPLPTAGVIRPLQIAFVLILARAAAGVAPRQLGLRRWAHWNAVEKSWLIQGSLLATVVFALVSQPVRMVARTPDLWAASLAALPLSLAWGFYQELIYRSLLQTELGRRWGAVVGILVANTLYTLGPLHFHYVAGGSLSAAAPMLAAIFAIGLYFGVLFDKTRNLWIVGFFHGLGNWYTVGVGPLAR
jgi:membrane protease YdiL (CAAX protease family)